MLVLKCKSIQQRYTAHHSNIIQSTLHIFCKIFSVLNIPLTAYVKHKGFSIWCKCDEIFTFTFILFVQRSVHVFVPISVCFLIYRLKTKLFFGQLWSKKYFIPFFVYIISYLILFKWFCNRRIIINFVDFNMFKAQF